MVLVELKINDKIVRVDPLALISKNDFWEGFFRFNTDNEIFKILSKDNKEIYQYEFKDEYNYGESTIFFIDKLDRLYENTKYKLEDYIKLNLKPTAYPDIISKFHEYYDLGIEQGGYLELDNLNTFIYRYREFIERNIGISQEDKDLYVTMWRNLSMEKDTRKYKYEVIYDQYYDNLVQRFLDNIYINDKLYKVWLNGINQQSTLDKIYSNKDRLSMPKMLDPYFEKAFRLMTNVVPHGSYLRKELVNNITNIKELYYIGSIILLFLGAKSNLLKQFQEYAGLDPKTSYKEISQDKYNVYNIDKLEENVIKFVFFKMEIDLKDIPLRSKTGLSREIYNEMVMTKYKKAVSFEEDEKRKQEEIDSEYLQLLGLNDGWMEEVYFEQKDWNDLISSKIKWVLILNPESRYSPMTYLDITNIEIIDNDNIKADLRYTQVYPVQITKVSTNKGLLFSFKYIGQEYAPEYLRSGYIAGLDQLSRY